MTPAGPPRSARYGVVYLRSFGDDGEAVVLQTSFIGKLALAQEEADIAEVLGEFGSVIVPGRPGERLPSRGVTPWTVPEGAWPAAVLDLVREARLLVVRLGAPGDHLDVLAEAGRCLRPEQILLLVPLDRSAYEAQRADIAAALGRRLPPFREGQARADFLRGFVRFASDGEGCFVTFERRWFHTRSRQPVLSRLRTAMRPVYALHGVGWTPEPPNLWRVLGAACGTLIALFCAAVLAAGLLYLEP